MSAFLTGRLECISLLRDGIMATKDGKSLQLTSPQPPGGFIGLLVASLLTLALIAIFYLTWKMAGLPFVPFDVFDWMTRVLPGRVLAFGIDTMVTIIRAL